MNVDEEILRENAIFERRSILQIARDRIAAMLDGYQTHEIELRNGFDDAKDAALTILAALISNPNV